MKRKFVKLAVLTATILVSVACSSAPAGQPMPQQNLPPQPNQPAQGAIPNQSGQANPVPGQPGMAGGPGLAGTVKSVSGNAIQLTVQNGNTVAVQVDDKTAYQKYMAGTLADIQVSSRLIVSGETGGGVTKAQTIQIAPSGGPTGGTPPNLGAGQPPAGGIPPAPPGGAQPGQPSGQPGVGGNQPGVGGTVKSISGNTIQLTSFDGNTTTVQVDSKTVIQKSASATLSDVKAGAQITVMVDSSSGSNVARVIQIGIGAKQIERG